jgi:2-phosphosulfolactate phosphatase
VTAATDPPIVDVVWVPAELERLDIAEWSVAVIDVIRATTSILTALESGADRVIPAATDEEARRAYEELPAGTGLLCGERRGVKIEGYDLGNSPLEYADPSVSGKTLIYRTTNGTPAMRRAMAGRRLRLACFKNARATSDALVEDLEASSAGRGIVLVCAGRLGRVSMDDAWCAGHLVERVRAERGPVGLSDAARSAGQLARSLGPPTAARLAETSAGRALGLLGLADDLEVCADLDASRVVPVWRGDAFVRADEGQGADERKGG